MDVLVLRRPDLGVCLSRRGIAGTPLPDPLWCMMGADGVSVPTTELPAFWAVVATVSETTADGYTRTGQVPTFYLSTERQGIRSAEHAARIGADVLRGGPGRSVSLSVADAETGAYYHAETFAPTPTLTPKG